MIAEKAKSFMITITLLDLKVVRIPPAGHQANDRFCKARRRRAYQVPVLAK